MVNFVRVMTLLMDTPTWPGLNLNKNGLYLKIFVWNSSTKLRKFFVFYSWNQPARLRYQAPSDILMKNFVLREQIKNNLGKIYLISKYKTV